MALRVCFATPGVLPRLIGQARVLGGSEGRALRLMRGIAARPEFAVSMIGFARSGDVPARVGNIEIVADAHRAARRTAWDRICARAMRYVSRQIVDDPPVRTTEAAAWQAAGADVLVTFGVGDYAAQMAAWCRRTNTRSVLVLGSDLDVSEDYVAGAQGRNVYGSRLDRCRYAIDHSDVIVTQTHLQRDRLQERFGRGARVVRNPIDVTDALQRPRQGAIWVGKVDRVKRPDLMIEIARRLPSLPVRMIANPIDKELAARLRETSPSNMTWVDFVPPEGMAGELAAACVAVNTSDFEGMPNVFLEAGMQETPVASLNVDPDDMLTRSGGGICARGDLDALTRAVAELAADSRGAGKALRHYVLEHHRADVVIEQFADLLKSAGPTT